MRIALIAAVIPVLLLEPGLAQAQNYPWCAQYGFRGGARNCGFVSWQQCMATVSGVGGYCEANPMFRPGDVRPVRRKARRQIGIGSS